MEGLDRIIAFFVSIVQVKIYMSDEKFTDASGKQYYEDYKILKVFSYSCEPFDLFRNIGRAKSSKYLIVKYSEIMQIL